MMWLWHSLYESAAMFWEVLWAFVLGFAISGALQVFVSKEQMSRLFGRAGLREVALAAALGAASSSCSYAAAAAAKTAFKKGAALVPALAFMFASTNLVFELGLVLWLLMGWTFVLAELVGAFVLIAVMWLIVRFTLPKGLEEEARQHREESGETAHDHSMHGHAAEDNPSQEQVSQDSSSHHHANGHQPGTSPEAASFLQKARNPETWGAVADAFIMDWSMLWKEMMIGFLIGGFLSVLVPESWWKMIFLADRAPGALRLLENAVAGPVVAVLSFVCSIGNIPLASLLWSGGISFGGVISFIYADLIVVPLILIYRKYYGGRAASYITMVLFASMVITGLLVDLFFTALHLAPTGQRPPNAIAHASFAWNYTTYLDLAALLVFGWFGWIHLHRRKTNSHGQGSHTHCH